MLRKGMALLILLRVSKFVYSVSLSSYYTFYLIEQFGLTKSGANLCLFIFLAAVAALHEGTADAPLALNRLPPRYIRHQVDYVFYLSERERGDSERQILEAVEYAFGFVQARTAMRARG